MTTFNLPDLGEGLPEAEIVAWHVKQGDSIKTDQPMLSVETAKAVVEVPSPQTGVVAKLHAQEGDIVATGAPLVDFANEGANVDAQPASKEPPAVDQGAATVVGNVPTGDGLIEETAIAGGSRRRKKTRIKATPSVRAEAQRLGIELADVPATGRNGQTTSADIANYTTSANTAARPAVSRDGMVPGQTETLRGPRRAMAQSMSRTRDEVAICTLFDDADINEWINKRDFTPRMLRAIVAGCSAEPRLNGFFDADRSEHQIESRVDVAMAVDTEDGLIVPVIRNVDP